MSIPKIGDFAPQFEAVTTQGPIRLCDYKGKWAILFSHPADFTPICTTEFMAFARSFTAFQNRGVELIGLSIDSLSSHLAWVQNVYEKMNVEIPFPVIADLRAEVAELYGMIHPESSTTVTVRCVFVIDPNQIIRAIIYYPLNVGRNIEEIMRLVDALQTVDKHKVATPANWIPGDDVVELPPQTMAEVKSRVEKVACGSDYYLIKRSLTEAAVR